MSTADTTKTVQITGGAAEGISIGSGSGGHKRHSRRRRVGLTTITQEGGTAASAPAVPAAPVAVATPTPAPPPPKVQTGGAVVVGPPKPKPKIVLEPSNKDSSKKTATPAKLKIVMKHATTTPVVEGTRKRRRQVHVNLTKLGRQMTRHKKIQQDSVTTPIESIKKTLQEAHLAKPDTTAPEELLRKMYADYQTLKQGAV